MLTAESLKGVTSPRSSGHAFLGNETACAEVVKLAAKAPGTLTPALAKVVGALLAAPKKAKLGKLGPAQLAKLREAVRKNADPSLLEPAARAAQERLARLRVARCRWRTPTSSPAR